VGFFRGFLAPFRGAIYVARERMWGHLVAPVILNLALGIGALAAASRYWKQELAATLAGAPVVGWIFLGVMTVLGGVVLFILLQPILGAVFCDRLSEAVEKRVRGSVPTVPLLASTGRALVHGLLKLVLYALALGVGLALTALTGLGSLVGVGLGALFMAYDGFDYPLGRRGASFGGKWAYLARHPALTVGYGLGTTLLYLVPLAFLVAPPFAAVGATLAYLDAETRSMAARKPGSAPGKGGTAPIQEVHNPVDISAS
jgi:uncharacterized protein involved in cysteine biosynthesis